MIGAMRRAARWRKGTVAVAAVTAVVALAGPARADHETVSARDNVLVTDLGAVVLRAGGPEGSVATATLTYYATRDGGFVGRGSYVVRIVGDDGTRVYRSSKGCARTGAIEYGDRVQIRVDSGFVAAGSRHHC
jgi:hypothetical protein